jgi:hypothetical protein
MSRKRDFFEGPWARIEPSGFGLPVPVGAHDVDTVAIPDDVRIAELSELDSTVEAGGLGSKTVSDFFLTGCRLLASGLSKFVGQDVPCDIATNAYQRRCKTVCMDEQPGLPVVNVLSRWLGVSDKAIPYNDSALTRAPEFHSSRERNERLAVGA